MVIVQVTRYIVKKYGVHYFFTMIRGKKPLQNGRVVIVVYSCGIRVIRAVIVEFVQSKPHHESHEYGTTITR